MLPVLCAVDLWVDSGLMHVIHILNLVDLGKMICLVMIVTDDLESVVSQHGLPPDMKAEIKCHYHYMSQITMSLL